ncbi:MAG: FAD-dependent oxidoreductase [Actinopolymorphaceae bacterium]
MSLPVLWIRECVLIGSRKWRAMTRTSMWLTQDRATNTYPALTSDVDVDLAVVGGGWVGLHTAYLAQREGATVAVLKARDDPATKRDTGTVVGQHWIGASPHRSRGGSRLYGRLRPCHLLLARRPRRCHHRGRIACARRGRYRVRPALRHQTVARRAHTGRGLSWDRFFPLEFQRRVAQDRLHVDVDVIAGGHLVVLTHPEDLAQYLELPPTATNAGRDR